eukprot:1159579-Pelagomonas_calceolata.AAC.7
MALCSSLQARSILVCPHFSKHCRAVTWCAPESTLEAAFTKHSTSFSTVAGAVLWICWNGPLPTRARAHAHTHTYTHTNTHTHAHKHTHSVFAGKQVFYCSETCARVDWPMHGPYCKWVTNGQWMQPGCRTSQQLWVANGALSQVGGRMAGMRYRSIRHGSQMVRLGDQHETLK